MVEKRGFLKIYLIVALLVGLLALIHDILFLVGISVTISTLSFSLLYLLFFLFSIVTVPLFHHFNVKKIGYVLPIYVVISYLIFVGVGGYLSAKNISTGNVLFVLGIVSALSSLFEAGFSVYLIKKLDVI